MDDGDTLSPLAERGDNFDTDMLYSHHDHGANNFVAPSPKLKRSARILKRISSTTSFDMNVLSATMRARKRKRRDVDDDNVSVQSLNIVPGSSENHIASAGMEKKSKRRSMVKMSSLVNMLSPATSKMGKALERSFSFKAPSSPAALASTVAQPSHSSHRQITPYKKPKPANGRDRRASRFWSETVNQETRDGFSSQEIKRQEAIYELVQGEDDLINDLTMVHQNYYKSMKQFKLLTEDELDSIFGIVERLVPFHQDLLCKLRSLRKSDGTTDLIGETLLQWVPNLRHYETYCANQVFAKGLLDTKKTDPKVEDFLTRCIESSFSRKLDLWNFLDLPRSRLVKYPLLLKQICKHTSEDHADRDTLLKVIEEIEAIIQDVDARMGESKCKQAIEGLQFLYDSQNIDLIHQSTSVLCSGLLKNDRGTKLHVILFEKVLVVTRQATRSNSNMMQYQVHKEPIPLEDLELIDLAESDGKKGSFKNKVLRHPSTDKSAFKVSFKSQSGHSHTLQARDEHDKRQWITCLQKAISEIGNTSGVTSQKDEDSVSSGSRSNKSSTSSLQSISSNDENTVPVEPTFTAPQSLTANKSHETDV